MELVDEKHVDQCVSTEKADEITSAHDMKTELSEWFATHRGKKNGNREDEKKALWPIPSALNALAASVTNGWT